MPGDPFEINYWKVAAALAKAANDLSEQYGYDHDALVNNLSIQLEKEYPNLDWANVMTDQWPLGQKA